MKFDSRQEHPDLGDIRQSLGRNPMRMIIPDGVGFLVVVRTRAAGMAMYDDRRRKHGCTQRPRC